MTATNKTETELMLEDVERQLVDWKRREKDYGSKGMRAPAHVTQRIKMLKTDARQLRAEITGRTDHGK